jgi:hypothetical protein
MANREQKEQRVRRSSHRSWLGTSNNGHGIVEEKRAEDMKVVFKNVLAEIYVICS